MKNYKIKFLVENKKIDLFRLLVRDCEIKVLKFNYNI